LKRGLIGLAAASLLMGMGAVAMVSDPSARASAQPAETQVPQKQAPERSQAAVDVERRRETDRIRDMYRDRTPRKHKNRASGERAHRKWRQRRSAGRG